MNEGVLAPGQDERHEARGGRGPVSRKGLVIGLVAALAVAVAVAVAGLVLLADDDGGPYTLVAPATAAGLPLDPDGTRDLTGSGGFDADYKQRVKTALGGTARSEMFAVYTDAADGLKIDISGMTGTGFAPGKHRPGMERLNREAGNPLPLRSVDPGPHGGSAMCTTLTGGVGCSWLTSTTFVVIQFSATGGAGGPSLDRAVRLLHTLRSAVEKPA